MIAVDILIRSHLSCNENHDINLFFTANVQYCIYQLVQLRALLEVGVGIVRQAEGGNSAVKLHLICRGNSCYKLDLKKLDGDFNTMNVQITIWFENYQKAYEKQGWKMNPLDWMQLWTELKWESIYGRFEVKIANFYIFP